MSRHPCSFESEGCPLFNSTNGCFEDVHHAYYPRKDYSTPTEKQFRELPENKQLICRAIHNAIHATEPTPLKPSVEVMRHAIELERERRIALQREVNHE